MWNCLCLVTNYYEKIYIRLIPIKILLIRKLITKASIDLQKSANKSFFT